MSEEDARESKGAYVRTRGFQFAETLWRMAQVEPSARHGCRRGIREYVVDLRVPVAAGISRPNDALGSGSVLQDDIPGWQSHLHSTGREHLFPVIG